MSRSYKKNPIIKDSNGFGKKQANKRVRRFKGVIPNGKAYRKLYNPWDISDWAFYRTWNDYWKEQLAEWKLRDLPYNTWSNKPRGYCADYCFDKQPDTHWAKQNPELHKDKHYGYWKMKFCGK